MIRRDLLKQSSLFAAGAALSVSGRVNAAAPRKKNFLLVHGAWHAAAHWNRLAKSLTAMGHNVFSIDLPGSGLNARYPKSYLSNDFVKLETEVSPAKDVHLSDYRDAIVAQIKELSKFGKVTLVGHSFGGLAITLAGEAVPEKIARLVYLTAFVPTRFKSLSEYSVLPENSSTLASSIYIGDPSVIGAVRINPRSGDAAYVEKSRIAFYGDVPNEEFIGFASYLNPDLPLAAVNDDARGTAQRWGAVPRTFIRCTQDRALPIELQDRMIAEADAMTPANKFDVKTLEASHSPFASMPDVLAGVLGGLL